MASSLLISVDNHYLAVLMSIALLFLLLFSSQQDCNLKSLAIIFFLNKLRYEPKIRSDE